MTNDPRSPPPEPHEERAAAPDDWPGIPGRSADGEAVEGRGDSEVTEEQRQLEAAMADHGPVPRE